MTSRSEYLRALVTVFEYETEFCSVYSHARKVASTHARLVELGEESIAPLLASLEGGEGGMHEMHLLGEITGEWPSAPADERIEGTTFVATHVAQARDLWIAWGKARTRTSAAPPAPPAGA